MVIGTIKNAKMDGNIVSVGDSCKRAMTPNHGSGSATMFRRMVREPSDGL